MQIQTERLTIVEPSDDDYECLIQLYMDPELSVHSAGPVSREFAIRAAASQKAHWLKYKFGAFVVKSRTSDENLGIVSLKHLTLDDKTGPDIGYIFLRSQQGKGYAYEAANALILHAFQHMGFDRITAFPSAANEASLRLTKKLGFQFVKKLPPLQFGGRTFSGHELWERLSKTTT